MISRPRLAGLELLRIFALGATAIPALVACGPAAPTPSWRADTAASRHVIIVPPLDDHVKLEGEDGSALDGDKLDIAWCAQICAGAARGGERVVGCFLTMEVPDELLLRLRLRAELLDCALRGPSAATSRPTSIDPKASHR